MYQLILTIHVLVALLIIGLVLLQQGKGADIGASFGSGASGTVFGSQGTGGFLFKLTAGLAFTFFATSVVLSAMLANQHKSMNDDSMPKELQESQVAPKELGIPLPGEVKKRV